MALRQKTAQLGKAMYQLLPTLVVGGLEKSRRDVPPPHSNPQNCMSWSPRRMRNHRIGAPAGMLLPMPDSHAHPPLQHRSGAYARACACWYDDDSVGFLSNPMANLPAYAQKPTESMTAMLGWSRQTNSRCPRIRSPIRTERNHSAPTNIGKNRKMMEPSRKCRLLSAPFMD
jgi:hypothetical protein